MEPQRDISRTIEAPPDGAGTESTPRRAADAAPAAGDAASTAGDEAKRAAAEAKDQARSVVGEAKEQVSGLVQQARDELRTQSADRSRQAAWAGTPSAQLQALTEGRPGDAGPLAGYVTDARRQVASFASRLEDRGSKASSTTSPDSPVAVRECSCSPPPAPDSSSVASCAPA